MICSSKPLEDVGLELSTLTNVRLSMKYLLGLYEIHGYVERWLHLGGNAIKSANIPWQKLLGPDFQDTRGSWITC